MAKTVVALLDNPDEALKAVDELLQSGFQKKDIGVVANDQVPAEFKAVMKDMGKGAAVGGLTGLLLAAATAIVPGFGPLVVAGPAAALVAGLAYGGLAGGLIGALISKGIPEQHAHAYAEGLRRGGTLVTVHAANDERVQRGVDVMKRRGALNLDERMRQWKREGWSGHFGAVEVYSMVIEFPERRRSNQPHSGEERRQA